MSEPTRTAGRVFKIAFFSKVARKARIADRELCEPIRQVMNGQAVDLGGGVFKKRLNRNMHRSIILAKGGQRWIYEYLFAKKDLDNIDDADLAGFRKLAKIYADLGDRQFAQLVEAGSLTEICHDDQTQV